MVRSFCSLVVALVIVLPLRVAKIANADDYISQCVTPYELCSESLGRFDPSTQICECVTLTDEQRKALDELIKIEEESEGWI